MRNPLTLTAALLSVAVISLAVALIFVSATSSADEPIELGEAQSTTTPTAEAEYVTSITATGEGVGWVSLAPGYHFCTAEVVNNEGSYRSDYVIEIWIYSENDINDLGDPLLYADDLRYQRDVEGLMWEKILYVAEPGGRFALQALYLHEEAVWSFACNPVPIDTSPGTGSGQGKGVYAINLPPLSVCTFTVADNWEPFAFGQYFDVDIYGAQSSTYVNTDETDDVLITLLDAGDEGGDVLFRVNAEERGRWGIACNSAFEELPAATLPTRQFEDVSLEYYVQAICDTGYILWFDIDDLEHAYAPPLSHDELEYFADDAISVYSWLFGWAETLAVPDEFKEHHAAVYQETYELYRLSVSVLDRVENRMRVSSEEVDRLRLGMNIVPLAPAMAEQLIDTLAELSTDEYHVCAEYGSDFFIEIYMGR